MRPINKRKREMNKKNWQLAIIVCLLAGCASQKVAEKNRLRITIMDYESYGIGC